MLEGLLIRRVGINARFGAELLGAGILWLSTAQPWRPADEPLAREPQP